MSSRASRMAYVRSGHVVRRWYPAPMPEIPAPTTSTSKCSVVTDVTSSASIAGEPWILSLELRCQAHRISSSSLRGDRCLAGRRPPCARARLGLPELPLEVDDDARRLRRLTRPGCRLLLQRSRLRGKIVGLRPGRPSRFQRRLRSVLLDRARPRSPLRHAYPRLAAWRFVRRLAAI